MIAMRVDTDEPQVCAELASRVSVSQVFPSWSHSFAKLNVPFATSPTSVTQADGNCTQLPFQSTDLFQRFV